MMDDQNEHILAFRKSLDHLTRGNLSVFTTSINALLRASVSTVDDFSYTLSVVCSGLERFFKKHRRSRRTNRDESFDQQIKLVDLYTLESELQVETITSLVSFVEELEKGGGKQDHINLFLKWVFDIIQRPVNNSPSDTKRRKVINIDENREKLKDANREFYEIFLTTLIRLCRSNKKMEYRVSFKVDSKCLPFSNIDIKSHVKGTNIIKMIARSGLNWLLNDVIFHYPNFMTVFAISRILNKIAKKNLQNLNTFVETHSPQLNVDAEEYILGMVYRDHRKVLFDILMRDVVEVNLLKTRRNFDRNATFLSCAVMILLVTRVEGIVRLLRNVIFQVIWNESTARALLEKIPVEKGTLFQLAVMRLYEFDDMVFDLLEVFSEEQKLITLKQLQDHAFPFIHSPVNDNAMFLLVNGSVKFVMKMKIWYHKVCAKLFSVDRKKEEAESVFWLYLLEIIGLVNKDLVARDIMIYILKTFPLINSPEKNKNGKDIELIERFQILYKSFVKNLPQFESFFLDKLLSELRNEKSLDVLINLRNWIPYCNNNLKVVHLIPVVNSQNLYKFVLVNWDVFYSLLITSSKKVKGELLFRNIEFFRLLNKCLTCCDWGKLFIPDGVFVFIARSLMIHYYFLLKPVYFGDNKNRRDLQFYDEYIAAEEQEGNEQVEVEQLECRKMIKIVLAENVHLSLAVYNVFFDLLFSRIALSRIKATESFSNEFYRQNNLPFYQHKDFVDLVRSMMPIEFILPIANSSIIASSEVDRKEEEEERSTFFEKLSYSEENLEKRRGYIKLKDKETLSESQIQENEAIVQENTQILMKLVFFCFGKQIFSGRLKTVFSRLGFDRNVPTYASYKEILYKGALQTNYDIKVSHFFRVYPIFFDFLYFVSDTSLINAKHFSNVIVSLLFTAINETESCKINDTIVKRINNIFKSMVNSTHILAFPLNLVDVVIDRCDTNEQLNQIVRVIWKWTVKTSHRDDEDNDMRVSEDEAKAGDEETYEFADLLDDEYVERIKLVIKPIIHKFTAEEVKGWFREPLPGDW